MIALQTPTFFICSVENFLVVLISIRQVTTKQYSDECQLIISHGVDGHCNGSMPRWQIPTFDASQYAIIIAALWLDMCLCITVSV